MKKRLVVICLLVTRRYLPHKRLTPSLLPSHSWGDGRKNNCEDKAFTRELMVVIARWHHQVVVSGWTTRGPVMPLVRPKLVLKHQEN